MTKKNVAIVGTAGIPARYGGFETLAEHLTRLLGSRFDFTVYCSSQKYPQKKDFYNKARLIYLPFGSNGKQSVIYDFISMLHALFYADVMLILGVSGCLLLPLIRLFFRGKTIVNIDGLEWRRDKWIGVAKLFLQISEKMAVNVSDVTIADHSIIQGYVRQYYRKKSELISYGADHVVFREFAEKTLKEYPFLRQPYALSVCRIEPENNIHIMIEAFNRPGLIPLVVVGNWDANKYALNLKAGSSKYANVFLVDPIYYDQAKLDQIRSNCIVYVHGHSAGGTNPSLIEAMALGRPVFAYQAGYNKAVTDYAAQYYSTAEQLYQLVQNADKDLLNQMGLRMKKIASEKYVWSQVAEKYAGLFDTE